ncbi:hypothetical protein [Micromonospora sp. NPDC023956]|uniref:hypothetical protein n=1 Tax=Micromonospora sp. NPDC023956 TaxID=3155722 RepID=UPI00340319DF
MGQRQESRRQHTDEQRRRTDEERGRDWADEAAQARTADDPRAVAPHDAAGRPTTGGHL